MRKKLLFIGLFLFICFFQSMAQQRTVTGKVSSTDGTPLAGASVTVVGQKTGVTSGTDGTFSINVPQNAKELHISYIGSESQTVDISSATEVSVSMVSSAQALTDVVVVGYGTSRRSDLTGAITSVKPKDFNLGVIHSADQLLQNKVAGLEVTNTSGQPGAATTIQIRGSSSIRSGANPLYVVDGIILDGGTARPSASTAFGTTSNSDPLIFINPNDIARIDILKDASSTAIYGSRGANGVIMITTKKGNSGPMKVDVGVNFSDFAGYMKKFEVLSRSQYLSAISSAKYGLPDSLQQVYNGGANPEILKAITQNKISQNYSLALSGGNENGNFRASFLASDYEGFIKKNNLKKYLASFNGQYNFIDNKLKVEFGAIAANFGEKLPPIGGSSGSTGSLISAALQWNPTFPIRIGDSYNFPSNGSGNPIAEIDALDDNTNVTEILTHISASYKLLPNLEYKILYGLNYGTGRREINVAGWLPSFTAGGSAAVLDQTLFTQILDHTLNYNAHLSDKLTLDALAGFEYYSRTATSANITANTFNFNLTEKNRIPLLYTNDLQNAKTQSPYSTYKDPSSELQSYFARATFNYLDKYFLTGTIRQDGSSKFGVNNKYAYFPSGAFKWEINNEDFMKDNNVFSNLGLRVSYGLTGNQEFPAGASKEQISISPYNTINGSVTPNPNLKWETSKQFDAGIDFAFAKGRVNGSIDYYNKNTSDILFATNAIQPAPGGTVFINLPDAHLKNSGVEGFLAVTAIQNQKITWELSGNVAYNKNVVTNFTDPNTGLGLVIPTGQITGQGVSGTTAQVFANNQPVNVWYLKKFSGFDKDGNQNIADNATFAGNPNPKVIAGFSTSLRYNKLTLSLNMGGSFGFLIYNNTATSVTTISGIAQGRNVDLNAYNSDELPSSGAKASDRFLESGNYWKLRNATVTYNIGKVGKYINNFSAYITGSNLFVITKFSGFDPEVNIDKSNSGYPSRSIEYIPYPTPRSITLGINFSL
ncbi:MAG: SusC/RagA family TonB-linked outer membrane protein [Ginsengibacter sp.]